MYKIEVAFNERWSCTYNRKSKKKKLPKVSAFWEMRPSAISVSSSSCFRSSFLQNYHLAA